MSTKANATIDDLYHVPENGKAELVNGEIVSTSPTGSQPGRAARKIAFSLYGYEQRTGTGCAAPDNVGFVVNLPHRTSFSPDAAFYIGDVNMRFVKGAPIFAAEVRSEGDYGLAAEAEMAAKRADYFAAGTHVVWDVDLLSDDVVRVYRLDQTDKPVVYRRGEMD